MNLLLDANLSWRLIKRILLNLPELQEADYRVAEQMIAFGLSGNPPAEIAEELREVWANIQARYASEHKHSFQQQADMLLTRVRHLLQTGVASDVDKAWLMKELEGMEAGLVLRERR